MTFSRLLRRRARAQLGLLALVGVIAALVSATLVAVLGYVALSAQAGLAAGLREAGPTGAAVQLATPRSEHTPDQQVAAAEQVIDETLSGSRWWCSAATGRRPSRRAGRGGSGRRAEPRRRWSGRSPGRCRARARREHDARGHDVRGDRGDARRPGRRPAHPDRCERRPPSAGRGRRGDLGPHRPARPALVRRRSTAPCGSTSRCSTRFPPRCGCAGRWYPTRPGSRPSRSRRCAARSVPRSPRSRPTTSSTSSACSPPTDSTGRSRASTGRCRRCARCRCLRRCWRCWSGWWCSASSRCCWPTCAAGSSCCCGPVARPAAGPWAPRRSKDWSSARWAQPQAAGSRRSGCAASARSRHRSASAHRWAWRSGSV